MDTRIKELVQPLRGYVQKILPAIYDDSMSYYELLSKLLYKLNETIEQGNDLYKYVEALDAEFRSVQAWFENVALPKEVSRLLNEWYDNGKLATIINDEVFNMKVDVVDYNADMTEIANELLDRPTYADTYYIDTKQYERNGLTFTEALKEACSVGGRNIVIRAGYHELTETIRIKPNTHIRMYGARILRAADINAMFINDSDGTKGGYLASSNITIEGGSLDLNGVSIPSTACAIAFGHIENVKIKNITFTNIYDWHYIELNSTKNGLIEGCSFTGYGNTSTGSEMVQLDLAQDAVRFPWFGPYDNTTCEAICIRSNVFRDGVNAIGSHSGVLGKYHSDIQILNNDISNFSKEAIITLNYKWVNISGNMIYSCWKGIVCNTINTDNTYFYTISNNILDAINKDVDSRAIQIGQRIHRGTISNNVVNTVTRHGIGVDYGEVWTISGNSVHNCGRVGIWGFGLKQSTIVGNTVLKSNETGTTSTYGITVGFTQTNNTDTNTVTVTGNTTDTIGVQGTTNVFVTNNTITNSGYFPTGQYDNTNVKAVNNFINGVFS